MDFRGLGSRLWAYFRRPTLEADEGNEFENDNTEFLAVLSVFILLAFYCSLVAAALLIAGCDQVEAMATEGRTIIVDAPKSFDVGAEWWSDVVHDNRGGAYILLGYGDSFALSPMADKES